MTHCTSRTTPLLLVLLFAAVIPIAVRAQDEDAARRITVQGEGIVRAEPDMATVHFGVVTRAEDPETARRENAKAAKQALNAVRDLGVPERKIRMQQLRLQPAREYNPDTKRWEEVGFEVARELVVELDSLERLPDLVTRIVQQGANRLNRVDYDLQDRGALRNEALQEAVENAEEKARLMAQTAGAEVGSVLRIDEQSVDFPRPTVQLQEMARAGSSDQAAPEPEAYAAGEIEVRAVVQVVYRLR